MLVILTACAGTPEATGSPALVAAPTASVVRPATSKSPPPCPRLAPALWPYVADAAHVRVVVERTTHVVLPPTFVVEAESPGAVQGTLPGTELCALAGTPGVGYVRPAAKPSPKGH